jgi:hypothetical protein
MMGFLSWQSFAFWRNTVCCLLAPLVVFPQAQRLINIALLALFAATAEQHDDF